MINNLTHLIKSIKDGLTTKRLLIILLALCLNTFANSQVKIEEEKKEYLELNTLKYEIFKGPSGGTYYVHTFYSAYEYPTIKEGFYTVGIFTSFEGLVTMYTELANLENLEDGLYKLSMKDKKIGDYAASKKGDKIKITGTSGYGNYAKMNLEDIKKDLETLKSITR
jgi:hypothetical protein